MRPYFRRDGAGERRTTSETPVRRADSCGNHPQPLDKRPRRGKTAFAMPVLPRVVANVDLNLFKIFDAVYSHGGITPAAEALFLTQPAVSHALTRLRDAFGDPLFVRQGNRMMPTARARAVIADVRLHLRGLQATLRGDDAFDATRLECTFKLGLRDALEVIVFAPLLRRLAVEAPQVRIESQRINPASMERDLTRGHLDLGLDIARAVGEPIHSERLCDEPLAVVLRKGHPLLKRQMTLGQYAAARHVLVTLRPEGPEVVDLVLSQLGVRRDVYLRCQHYFAACQVVTGTDWLLTMPFTVASVIARQLPLAVVPTPFAIAPLEVRLYWHSRVHEDPAMRWVREVLRTTILSSLPGRTDSHPHPVKARAPRDRQRA